MSTPFMLAPGGLRRFLRRLFEARCLRCGRLVQAAGYPPCVLFCGGWRCRVKRKGGAA